MGPPRLAPAAVDLHVEPLRGRSHARARSPRGRLRLSRLYRPKRAHGPDASAHTRAQAGEDSPPFFASLKDIEQTCELLFSEDLFDPISDVGSKVPALSATLKSL
jgi:hypothetical protein